MKMKIVSNVVAVLTTPTGEKETFTGANIVTTAGDEYYAQMAAGETPATDFTLGGIRLGTNFISADKDDTDVDNEHSNGRLAVDATYPKADDDDSDNQYPGANTITWRFSYGYAVGNIAGIEECAIVDTIAAPTVALCHAKFAIQFTKSASSTMKIFVNHKFVGG